MTGGRDHARDAASRPENGYQTGTKTSKFDLTQLDPISRNPCKSVGTQHPPPNRLIRRWALARRLRAGGRATQAAPRDVGHRCARHAGRDPRLKDRGQPTQAAMRGERGRRGIAGSTYGCGGVDPARRCRPVGGRADGHVLAAVRRPGHGADDAGSLRPVTRQQPGWDPDRRPSGAVSRLSSGGRTHPGGGECDSSQMPW